MDGVGQAVGVAVAHGEAARVPLDRLAHSRPGRPDVEHGLGHRESTVELARAHDPDPAVVNEITIAVAAARTLGVVSFGT
jgi:hypothetical protein